MASYPVDSNSTSHKRGKEERHAVKELVLPLMYQKHSEGRGARSLYIRLSECSVVVGLSPGRVSSPLTATDQAQYPQERPTPIFSIPVQVYSVCWSVCRDHEGRIMFLLRNPSQTGKTAVDRVQVPTGETQVS